MKKSKNILSIDASSNAIGWAIFNEGKLVDSGAVVLEKEDKKEHWTERINILESRVNMEVVWSNGFKKVDTLLMNLGYAQTNGVDEGALALVNSQHTMISKYCREYGFNYAPVLDTSWLPALKKITKFEGTFNELKKRPIKKKETVRVASRIKYAEQYPGVKIHVEHKTGEWYGLNFENGTIGHMSDDEADAIFAGYTFVNEMISDTTLLNRKMKIRQEKISNIKKELKKLETKFSKLKKDQNNIENEIKMYEEKNASKHSKVNDNAIESRRIKHSHAQKQFDEFYSKYKELSEELWKIEGR